MKHVCKIILFFVLLSSLSATSLAAVLWAPVNNKAGGVSQSSNNSQSEQVDLGDWRIEYYVDNFKQPTKEGYITNDRVLNGTFSNSAVTDAKLTIVWIIDKKSVALKLYEYGDNLVKGYGTANYSVTMRDSQGKDTILSASQSDGQDCLYFSTESATKIKKALSSHDTLSFFLQNKKYNTDTYLFTIDDTDGFGVAWKELTGKAIYMTK